MSLRWIKRVFAADQPRGSDRLMLLALADYADDEGICWPSIPKLAAKCGVTTSAARRTVRRLCTDGYLATDVRAGRSTLYRLLDDRLSAPQSAPPPSASTPGVDATPGADASPGVGATPGVDAGPGVDVTPTPGVNATPPLAWTPGEPSKNHYLNQQQQQERVRTPGGGTIRHADRAQDVVVVFSNEQEGAGGVDLVGALVARGVSEATAKGLVHLYDDRQIRDVLAAGVQHADGPGWYVRALRDGWVLHRERTAAVRTGIPYPWE